MASTDDMQGKTLELAISPAGRMHLEHVAGTTDLEASAQARIERAFAAGDSHGLLSLGAVELRTWLPPSLAFGRDIAQEFMARLCATPDLAARWDSVEVVAPAAEVERLLAAAPPMTGAEYLDGACIEALFDSLQDAAHAGIAAHGGDVQAWLRQQHPGWHMVGRVVFNLAENKASAEAPFAFLASDVGQVSQQAGASHQPLGRALQEYAGAGNRDMLLNLLLPVDRAAGESPWLRALVDSGAVFRPQAWTPADAHDFLRNIPVFEAAGIVVRIPDWWKPQQPLRPQVTVSVGKNASGIGMEAMLDFDVSLSLDGEALSDAEWQQMMASSDGLVRLKGRWVELDRDKLAGVLAHWKQVQSATRGDGVSFLEGMRLLAGAALGSNEADLPATVADWSSVVAGDWMNTVLEGLRQPRGEADPGPAFLATLRPYQQEGVRWLWWLSRLGLGACLADDMGLGKTVQVLALLSLAKREGDTGPHLLVLPASLIGNWQAEIARFCPGLRVLVAHGSAMPARALAAIDDAALAGVDLVITSYGSLIRLPWLQQVRWSMVVLDEAQAIKNPGARQTRAAKALHSRVRLVLTGTPVENRLGELWSLFDFICPGLLGTGAAFTRFVRRLEKQEHASYAPLRRLVQPYILRRLKSDRRIIDDLPDKTEVKAYCGLSRAQARLYEQAVDALATQIRTLDGIARRGAVLAFLLRFKQICNHPSLWLGDGDYAAGDSGKFARLQALAEEIAARQQKLLVFTQFQEMTGPLAGFLQTVFGRPGLVLHGGTPVKSRKALVDRFQDEEGPPFFVLSIKAGGTGLNLTAASHVIHFDRWWNPAVENQATDRAYRIGQKKNVLVHKFICRGTVEEKIDAMIEDKLDLSNAILADGGETMLTEMSNEALLQMVKLDINSAIDES